MDKSVDGVIKVLFRHKYNDCNVVLFGCYIPPEHSTRGRMSHEVFSYLSTHIYQDVTDMDCILICGDINARIGSLSDTIVGVDGEIPNRAVLDSAKNLQGEEFVDFLQEMTMCVLNGRFSNDNYTCISQKGKSVVDYICVLQDQYNMYSDFEVHTVTDLIDRFSLVELISDVSRPPDHSIVISSVHLLKAP